MSEAKPRGFFPKWDAGWGEGGSAPQGTRIAISDGLAEWLVREQVSLAFTSYQSSQLFLAGVNPGGQVLFSHQAFGRATGLSFRGGRLFVGALMAVWRIENILRPGEVSSKTYDAVYVPRMAYTVGDLDLHEVATMADGKPVFVNTRFNCIATIDGVHAFRPLWKPAFISELVKEDRCHLNGLGMDKGRPRYATALRAADVLDGWREGPDKGLLIDIEQDRTLSDTLFIPHSPRLADGQIYVLESGRGVLARIDPHSLEKADIAFCPGFLRGLAVHGNYALITLSKPRKNDFDGVPLDDEIKRRGIEAWCGIAIVDLRTGETIEWIRVEGDILQLFDVAVLPGVRCPRLLGPGSIEVANAVTFEPRTLPAGKPRKPARR